MHHLTAGSAGPNWAAILEAISTAVAAVFAIVAAVVAYRTFRRQNEQLKLQRDVTALQMDDLRDSLHRRRREQASKVTLDVTKDVDGSQPGGLVIRLGVRVVNGSEWPLYGFHYLSWIKGVRWADGPRPSYYTDDLGPGSTETGVHVTHPDRDFGDW